MPDARDTGALLADRDVALALGRTAYDPTDPMLSTIEVNDGRPGRPRSRPDRVIADRVSSRAAWEALWREAAGP